MNTYRRKALAIIAVPLLSAPSAIGVYTYLSPSSGVVAAGLAAGGFELLYISTAILILATSELRRYARNVALSAVGTAVLFNTLSHYAAAVPDGLTSAAWNWFALGLALVTSLPLAGLSYAMSVLLHRLSEADATQPRTEALLNVELANARAEAATLRNAVADLRRASQGAGDDRAEQLATSEREAEWLRNEERAVRKGAADQLATVGDTLATQQAEIARLQTELAAASQGSTFDLATMGAALRERHSLSWAELANLFDVPVSTLRSRVEKAQRAAKANGHAVEVSQ